MLLLLYILIAANYKKKTNKLHPLSYYGYSNIVTFVLKLSYEFKSLSNTSFNIQYNTNIKDIYCLVNCIYLIMFLAASKLVSGKLKRCQTGLGKITNLKVSDFVSSFYTIK